MFLTFYFYLNIKKIIFSEGDKNVSTVGLLNLEKLGVVPFNDTKVVLFHVLRKHKKEGQQLLFEDGELDQYLDIQWVNKLSDWNNNEFKEIVYKTKICEPSDFGDDEKAISLFNSWKGFTLICPEPKAFENI